MENLVSIKNQQTNWASLAIDKRVEHLRELFRLFNENKIELAEAITSDINKPIKQSISEIDFNMKFFNWFLENAVTALKEKTFFENQNEVHKLVLEPIGTFAIILPYNFPFGLFIMSVIPSLLAGNAAIVKFSNNNEKFSSIISTIVKKTMEVHKILIIKCGDEILGKKIIEQDIDFIWFVGSQDIGKEIKKIAMNKNIKTIVEMGGSNACIILKDFEINSIIDKVYFERFLNNGQYCDAIKRIIIHESKQEEFITKLVDLLNSKNVGPAHLENTDISPLANENIYHKSLNQLNDALIKGAKVVKTKHKTNMSNILLPTLLIDVNIEMRVWTEEVFAPILPIIAFKNTEEAINYANRGKFDLGASIYTNDMEQATKIAEKLNAGTIQINNTNHWKPENPFGGIKYSGTEKTGGLQVFEKVSNSKLLCFPK